MDIYDYFNSSDIAAYCKEIGHEFNTLEMAVIVAISNKTIKEKHAGYRQIIEDYPDMPIPESGGFQTECESLHQHLEDIIANEEKNIELFYTPQQDMVYRFSAWKIIEPHSGRQDYDNSTCRFKTFDKAWEDIQDWNCGDEYEHKPFSKGYRYSIYKERLDEETLTGMHAEIDENMELLNIWRHYDEREEDSEKEPEPIDDICIYIPVPFEKGDILVDGKSIPFVLDDLLYWSKYYKAQPDSCCGWDMQADGHYFFEGKLMTNHGFILNELRYFKDQLQGQERFLRHLSSFVKNNDSGFGWLFDVYEKYRLEELYKKQDSLFGSEYIPLELEDKTIEEKMEAMLKK